MKNLEEKEMSFLDHLEELRWHLIRSLAAITIGAVAAFVNKDLLFHWVILGPTRPDFWTYVKFCELGKMTGFPELCTEKLNFIIQNRTVMGQFSTHLTVSFVAGLIVSFPYVFWELWRFIKPGLHQVEASVTGGAVFWVSLLFGLGTAFGYFLLAPISLNFLANYVVDASIENQFDLLSYISMITTLVLACGLMFQLPMVIYVLAKFGIAKASGMRSIRKHAIVVILFVSAVITPTSDPFTLTLVALPLYLLYETGIVLASRVEAKEAKGLV